MLRVGVMVSGGGTNLQAIFDALDRGTLSAERSEGDLPLLSAERSEGDLPVITNAEISVVISNNKNAFALERARTRGIEAVSISPKDFVDRESFNRAFLAKVDEYELDLIVLAGFLVTIPQEMIDRYPNRIINIHPSLIPAFCGVGYYGLKVHEGALARGVKITGATVHYVDGGMDTGPIILQRAVEVKEDDTAEVLQRRVMEEAEWIILPQAIHQIANQ